MAWSEIGTVRRVGLVGGVAVGVVLCAVAPVGAEPELPALGHAERVAGLGSPAAGVNGYSGDGFDATKARIGFSVKIAVTADGAVLIADSTNRRLRRVGTDGVIDTVPAPAAVSSGGGPWFARGSTPWMVDSGPDGSVYLSDREEVARLGRDGSWTPIGGGGDAGFADGRGGGDGGPATNALLNDVENLDVDATGAVYLADGGNGRVRRIDRNGTITTVAGGGGTTPSTDPVPARSARLNPFDIAVDPAGGFWMVDHKRLTQTEPRLVHVDAKGMLTAVPLDLRSTQPFPIAMGADRSVYIGVGAFLHRVAQDGSTTLLGGPFTDSIADIAVAGDGTVYTTTGGAVERLVEPDPREGEKLPAARAAADRWAGDEPGTVHRVAGDGEYREGAASAGAEPGPQPTEPRDVVAAPDGGAYVFDTGNARILHVSPAGDVEEHATLPSDQAGPIVGLTRGPDGALYTLDVNGDRLLRIDPDGAVTEANGVAVAEDYRPAALVLDKAGNAYLPADDGQALLRVAPGGRTTPVAGGGERDGAEADGRPATQASVYLPQAAAVGPDGSVAVLEEYLNAVRVVRSDGTLTTIAGNADTTEERAGFAGDGGKATSALLNSPRAVAFAPDGTVYIADTLNNRVRKVGRNGVITTVAGTGERDENGDDGPATRAALIEPDHVTVADDGALWVTSAASTGVRRIDRDGTITTPTDFASADTSASPAEELTLDGYALAVDPQGTVYVDAGETIQAVSSGKARAALDTTGLGGPVIASAADGSLYYGGAMLRHRFPDGAETPVAGAAQPGGTPMDGADARTVNVAPTDVTVDPDGTPFVATKDAVFALVGGRLDQRWHLDDPGSEDNHVNGIAVGPDGTLYVALSEHKVIAVRDGRARTFAGVGDDTVVDDDIGDGGAATDAVLQTPRDVAVTSDGSVFVSTTDGIRRIDPDGDIDTVVVGQAVEDGSLTQYTPPDALAVDAHDNLYFTEPALNQTRVVVRPAAMPDQSGTSVWWWLAGGALALSAAAFLLWRRRMSAGRVTADAAASPADPENIETPSREDEPARPDPDSTDEQSDDR